METEISLYNIYKHVFILICDVYGYNKERQEKEESILNILNEKKDTIVSINDVCKKSKIFDHEEFNMILNIFELMKEECKRKNEFNDIGYKEDLCAMICMNLLNLFAHNEFSRCLINRKINLNKIKLNNLLYVNYACIMWMTILYDVLEGKYNEY